MESKTTLLCELECWGGARCCRQGQGAEGEDEAGGQELRSSGGFPQALFGKETPWSQAEVWRETGGEIDMCFTGVGGHVNGSNHLELGCKDRRSQGQGQSLSDTVGVQPFVGWVQLGIPDSSSFPLSSFLQLEVWLQHQGLLPHRLRLECRQPQP